MKILIGCVKFAHRRRDVMKKSIVTLHNSSSLLRDMKYCVSANVNEEKSNALAKEKVLEELKKVKDCGGAFPSSYYCKDSLGNK